jgi:hypothetical protein
MVELNNNKEYYHLDDILLEMGMGPDALNIVPPHFLTDDNRSLLEARETYLVNTFSFSRNSYLTHGNQSCFSLLLTP